MFCADLLYNLSDSSNKCVSSVVAKPIFVFDWQLADPIRPRQQETRRQLLPE